MTRYIEPRFGCRLLHNLPDGLDSLAQRGDRVAVGFPDTLQRSQLRVDVPGQERPVHCFTVSAGAGSPAPGGGSSAANFLSSGVDPGQAPRAWT